MKNLRFDSEKLFDDLPGLYFAKNHYLLLEIEYRVVISLYNTASRYYVQPLRAGSVLRDAQYEFSTEQSALLNYLQDIVFYEEKSFDWGVLFELIKNSGLPVYLGAKAPANLLAFIESPAKLSAQLLILERPLHVYSDAIKNNKVALLLSGEYYGAKKLQTLCGRDKLIVINRTNIAIHQMTENLMPILARLIEYGTYNYRHGLNSYRQAGSLWRIELSNNEVLHIVGILQDAKACFDLTTELAADITVEYCQKSGPCMVIDYDSTAQTLNVDAVMKYGEIIARVALLHFFSHQKGRVSIGRRDVLNSDFRYIDVSPQMIRYADIDYEAEEELFRSLTVNDHHGFNKKMKCERRGLLKILNYQLNTWPNIETLGYDIEFVRDKFDFAVADFRADFKIDLSADNDLLAFDATCYLGDDRLTIADLQNYIKNKEQYIRLNSGRQLKVANWAELERFVLMLENFKQNEAGQFEGRMYHAPEIDNIIASSKHYQAKLTQGFKNFMTAAREGKLVQPIVFEARAKKHLRHYQKEGIDWLYFLRQYHFAGILADDMGLGKTLQALTVIAITKSAGPTIVICPKTLLFNWEDEAQKFYPDLKVLVIDGSAEARLQKINTINDYDLIVTSYPALKKDIEIYSAQKIKFNYCILDEAQFVKNHTTQNAKAVKQINSDYRLALTGTPIENSVAEVWSIFDFLMPGFLGNHKSFVRRFQNPIMKENSQQAMQDLRHKIECFVLRRTKAAVLRDLPPKIEQTIHSELTEAQNLLYQEILVSVREEILRAVASKGFNKSQIHILAGLTKLRQVCNHPQLLLKNKKNISDSVKLEVFHEIIDELLSAGRKVLVFSQFTKMLDILAEDLNGKNIQHLYLSGQTKDRKTMVNDFNNNPDNKVFLISLKAGGTGLNLTSADAVIIFDPWWNPSVENQAIDRTHRIGQKNSVNVYRLVTKGTIEEKILKLQEKKKFLFDNLVGESKDIFKKLTWDDVKGLFEI